MRRAENKFAVAFYHSLHSKDFTDVTFTVSPEEDFWSIIVDTRKRKIMFLPKEF